MLTPSYSKGTTKKSFDDFKRELLVYPWDENKYEPDSNIEIDWEAMDREDKELKETFINTSFLDLKNNNI